MKYKLTLFFCFLFSFNLSSQIKNEHFLGKWKFEKKDRLTKLITLKKDGKGYGITIYLFNNYKIRESYLAPCGNDSGILRSAKKGIGNWSYNDKDKVFISSIPILHNEKKVFKLISFNGDEIVLKPLENQ